MKEIIEKKIKKIRISKSFLFLLMVVFLYAVVGFFDIVLVKEALGKTLEIFLKILPILVLVFGLIYLINRYFDTKKVQKHLGEESGLRGWIYAVVAGVVLAGPPYILYPIFGKLQDKGMKNSLIAVILYNRNVKLQFLPALIYYFGLPFSIILSFYMIVFSLFNGILVGILSKNSYN